MSNFAEIRFTAINANNSTVLIGEVFSFYFDGDQINCEAASINDFSSNVLFKTEQTPSFYLWAYNVVDLINTYYAGVLGLKLSAFLGSSGIQIEATEFGHYFESDPLNHTILDVFNPNFGAVTEELIDSFSIAEITVEQAAAQRDARCVYKIKVENHTPPVELLNIPSGGIKIGFTDPYYYLNYYRSPVGVDIQMIDSNNNLSQIKALPSVTTWLINEVITTGSTATIVALRNFKGSWDTTLTYSIDGINYTQSNNFSNLPTGIYTAHILDSLGGRWSKYFQITNLTNKAPEFIDISDVNSLQFRDDAKYGNYKSLFERQKFTNIEERCFTQTFRGSLITTQIRTSFDNVIATMNGNTYNVIKVVDNLNQIDWRDCKFSDGGNNKTLVYFDRGNIYNPDNGQVVGQFDNVTVLGIKLDDWQTVGNILDFTFGSFIVSSVVRSTVINGSALVIDTPFLSFVPEICKTTYNKEDWNVYEFDIDMGLLDTTIEHQMIVDFTDSIYAPKRWISEPFRISTDSDLIELVYSGDQTINDMIATGIDHRMFLEAQFFDYEPITDIETFEDDRMNEVTLARSLNRNIMLKTHAIPQYLAHKIGLAMLFDTIFIDGIQFEPVNQTKVSTLADKNNPFLTLVQAFRPLTDTAISNESTDVINRVLGASTITVLGA